MRIISWNINGLLSCIKNHSFLPVELLKPDVICCQETRTNQQPEAIKGYHHYWTQTYGSHYGGLLTMSKEPASRIWYGVDVQKIDEEHRILVTEFSQAIVVNCYAPRMGEKLSRVDFRKEWDEALMGMVLRLQTLGKPVIVCGDMNVARLDIDMYQSERNRYEQEGFLTAAQSDVETFLDQGYVDAFREKHPTQKDSYTWWSSRFAKRSSGEGIRLDYIFIPTQIAGKIEDVRHLEKVMGSDHCPVEVDLSIEAVAEDISRQWEEMDFDAAEAALHHYQERITKAVFRSDLASVRYIQKQMRDDLSLRCLAVRKVVMAQSGPGVDRVRWRTSQEMMMAAIKLGEPFHASPLRQIKLISKNTGKERMIGIPTYFDRAMSVLQRYGMSHLKVPDVLLLKKIPDNARLELEKHMAHIIKKYGL